MENRRSRTETLRRARTLVLAGAVAWVGAAAAADGGPSQSTLSQQVQGWAQTLAASLPDLPQARVEVEVGSLDKRLRLAPCEQVESYLPTGSRPWGRTRVALRCLKGPSHWNVFLPVTVKLWAPAPVLREPRPAGHMLQASDFIVAEVDWAAQRDAPLAQLETMVGRSLAHGLAAGQPVRAQQLQRKQWFAAGDTVRVVARGKGYSVSGEGQALTRGLDGETARVRTTAGRIVTGTAVGAHQVEIPL